MHSFSEADLDSLTVTQSQLVDSGGVKYIGLTLRTQSVILCVTTLSFHNQHAALLSRANSIICENLGSTLRAVGELQILE